MPSTSRHLNDPELHADSRGVETNTYSIAHIVNALRRYTNAILLSLAAVVFLYVLVAVLYYALSPSVAMTRLPFRLEFEGADHGTYPNGLKFSSSEIVSTPILTKVYASNELKRWLPFSAFKDSLFVQEANLELQRLEADYTARLADPKLTPVDRERIEREFDLKKESLRHAEYTLVMASNGLVKNIPRDVREKVLGDILNEWAEFADKEKGALRYRFPVLTTNLFQQSTFATSEPIIALDMLRSLVNRVLANIDELKTIPGAETVRVGDGKSSLEETRIALEDIRRFQIEPLIARVYEHGLVTDPLATAYFQTQLGTAQRDEQEAQLRVSTLQDALVTYMGRTPRMPAEVTQTAAAKIVPAPAEQPVMPQLSDSFLDRLVKLASDSEDKSYRQMLLNRANEETFERLTPAQKEVAYYTALVGQLKNKPAGSAQNRADELKAVAAAQTAAYNGVVHNVQIVSEIYKTLSRDLDPDTALYTRTGPVFTRIDRPVSGFRLFAVGVAVTLFAIPVILIACLFHARLREEESDAIGAEPVPQM